MSMCYCRTDSKKLYDIEKEALSHAWRNLWLEADNTSSQIAVSPTYTALCPPPKADQYGLVPAHRIGNSKPLLTYKTTPALCRAP
jgi:hypothetical protein